MGVTPPQQRADQVSTLPVEDHKRMVDVLSVIAVVLGAFLIAVGGVVCGIEVQKHFLGNTLFASLLEVELEDGLGYSVARAPVGRVLKARDGRLARQIDPLSGRESRKPP